MTVRQWNRVVIIDESRDEDVELTALKHCQRTVQNSVSGQTEE